MRRWLGIGATLAVLVATLATVFGSREDDSAPGTADGREARAREDASEHSLSLNALLSASLPSPRGSLFIRGTVVGIDGRPLAGAVVVATAPTPGETLSTLPCPCDDSQEKTLPRCSCGRGVNQLVEHVAERQGEVPPLARTTSDAEGRFSLEGLEAGAYALWADGPFGTTLREDVQAGSEGIELRVGLGRILSGHILDEDGNPVEGALVTALLVQHSRFFDTLSDARGNWRLGPLPMGDYHLVFTRAGLLPEHSWARGVSDRQLEVTLFRPLRLEGQVLRDGEPVAGAPVHAEGEHHERDTATDAQGHFTFEGLRPSTYEVSTAHAGLEAMARNVLLEPGMDSAEVLLELGTSTRVTGTVRDTAGHPIPGATVSVSFGLGRYYGLDKSTRTASDGTWSLGPIPPGKHSFGVKARRFLTPPDVVKQVDKPTSLDFTLGPAPVVAGRVLNAAGQPLANVELELVEATGDPDDETVDRTRSGEDGTFTLDARKPVSHHLQALHEDVIPTVQTVQAPASGLQVVLPAGARVEGEVVDEQQAPVARARILLRPAEGPHRYQLEAFKQDDTDERGRFALQGLKPGRYLLSVWSGEGVEARTLTQPLEVRGTETERARLQLPVGLTLSGIVVDGTGKPVPDAGIRIEPLEVEDALQVRHFREQPRTNPRTGADGRFLVRNLAAGPYQVRAYKDGYLLNAVASGREPSEDTGGFHGVKTRAGATDLRLVLEKRGQIRGHVVRPDGTPVTRFTVDGDDVVDPRGAFALTISESGTKKLVFTAPSLARTTLEVQQKEGEDTELGQVVLSPGRTVRGRVVDAANGAPVAEARVDVRDESGSFLGSSGMSTAQDGTFKLLHVEERPLLLNVRHPEYKPMQLALAAEQTEVTVTLDAGATLRGTVHLSSARLLSVTASSLVGDYRKRARISENGYELRGLPAGTYVVHVGTTENDEKPPTIHPRWVELPASGVVVLDIEEARAGATLRLRLAAPGDPEWRNWFILVAGRISLPDSREALQRVAMLTYKEEQRGSGVFRLLPEGTYTLFALKWEEEGLLMHREELELPGQGEVPHEVALRWERIPGLTSASQSE